MGEVARGGDAGLGEGVGRGKAHRDLVLSFDGLAPKAIEDKVWSLRDKYQLSRYARDALSKPAFSGASLVLLSLADPLWPSNSKMLGGRTWIHLSYSRLADRLNSVASVFSGAHNDDDRLRFLPTSRDARAFL